MNQLFLRACRALFLMLSCGAATLALANDPVPASGTLSPASKLLTFVAGPFPVTNESYSLPTGGMCSPAQVFRCDEYTLTLALPAGYADAHPDDVVRITTAWADATEDYDIYILDPNDTAETDLGGGQSTTGKDPEIANISVKALKDLTTLTIRIVPYTAKGGTTTTTIELVSPPPVVIGPPPLKPTGEDPRFYIYAAPPELGNGGEPSIGYNPKTKRAMYFATGNGTTVPTGGSVLQINFPENLAQPLPEACDANWVDVTSPYLEAFDVDAILFTEQSTGRTFASELLSVGPALLGVPGGLEGLNSIFMYTDDDGATWIPGQFGPPQTSVPPPVIGTVVADGLDHQSVGSGPYAAGAKPATALVDYAVYYCSQGYVQAFCTRSDDGGLTFPSIGSVIYTEAADGCGGLHGHVRVAPDGTVYVPNKNCNGKAAVAVSEDSGKSWTVHADPYSSTSGNDPQMALASDGTGYLCYVGSDGHPHVTVTKDKGNTWSDDYDIGYYAGVQAAVFPQAIAGDPDRAACAFVGASTPGNYQSADYTGIWYPYVATTYDGGKTWHTVNLSPNDPIQREGGIWLQGGGNMNRNLLDFNEITLDEQGRVMPIYADGCVGGCVQQSPNSYSAHAFIARQSGGRSLLAAFDQPAKAPLAACLAGQRDQVASHLSWRVPDHQGSAITGYKIFRGTSAADQTLLTQIGASKPGYEDVTADPTVANYSYTFTALNAKGESVSSNLITLPVTAVPVVAGPCTLPGVQVITDPSGDNTNGPASTDIRSVSIAEPGDMEGMLVFTIQVASMTATPPPGFRWVAYFVPPGDIPGGDENYYVAMVSDTATPTFEYGTSAAVSPDPSGTAPAFRTYHKLGSLDASSGFSTDGSIVLVLDKANVPTLTPGAALTGVTASTRNTAPGPAGGQGLSLDTSDTAGYTLRAANACITGARGPLATLVADVNSGDAPLLVHFSAAGSSDPDGDSITSYTFSFGDGSSPVTQSQPTISHVYAADGTYAATATAKNSHGTQSSNAARQLITVGSGAGTSAPAASASRGRFGGALPLMLLLPLLGCALARRRT